jgi:hypothetical protein
MKKGSSRGVMGATLPCTVSGGMFKSERIVAVELPDGSEITAFVDRHQVIPDREVEPNEEYEGEVRVAVVQMKKDSAIIDLPQAGLTQGPRLEVPKKAIKT